MSTIPTHTPQSMGLTSPTALEVSAALLGRRVSQGRRKSWRALAVELGFTESSGAMLSRIVAGKQKPSDAVYASLGIEPPAKLQPVPHGHGVGRLCAKCDVDAVCVCRRVPGAGEYPYMTTQDQIVIAALFAMTCGIMLAAGVFAAMTVLLRKGGKRNARRK